MIYAPFGTSVKVVAARVVPVWVCKTAGEIWWEYTAPRRRKIGQTVDELPIWHIQVAAEKDGELLWDGKFEPVGSFKADDGWKEIDAACAALEPEQDKALRAWDGSKAPAELWPLLPKKMVA